MYPESVKKSNCFFFSFFVDLGSQIRAREVLDASALAAGALVLRRADRQSKWYCVLLPAFFGLC